MKRCTCNLVIGVCLVTLVVIACGGAWSRMIDASERRARARWLRSDLDRNGSGKRWKGHLVVRGMMRGGKVVVHV